MNIKLPIHNCKGSKTLYNQFLNSRKTLGDNPEKRSLLLLSKYKIKSSVPKGGMPGWGLSGMVPILESVKCI